MKKSYLILAAAAIGLTFASCSGDESLAESPKAVETTVDDGAVSFDAYVNRSVTRAGTPDEVTTTTLKYGGKHAASGFGVFAYYTDGEKYAGNTKPNFMYNQQVIQKNSTSDPWTYDPVKYWPNEFGSDAISDQVDYLSFFAYAPWVKVDPLTGVVNGDTPIKNTENIVGMTRNNATGDPFVKYIATLDATNSVDLCYGVAKEHFTSSASTSFANNIAAGSPYVDVTKPSLGSKIHFDFKHVLAKLNVRIDAAVDAATPSAPLDGKTRIWVRSVTFEGITTKGSLNLRTGEWYQIDAYGDNKISTGSVTVYDGRKDGKEPIGEAANEEPASLNPAIVQSLPYSSSTSVLETTNSGSVTGVTASEQNLFKKTTDEKDPIFVIPTGEKLKVTVVYDVETLDENLAYYLSDGVKLGSTIQNSITKTIDTFGAISAGMAYTLKLHLGMKSVEFDAYVSDWDGSLTGDSDHPSNIPTFAISGTPYYVNIPAGAGTYNFAISGLAANDPVACDLSSADGNYQSATANAANGSGIAAQTVTYKENKTVVTGTTKAIKWTPTSTTPALVINFTQKPGALGLGYTSFDGSASAKTITLSKTTESAWTAVTADATHVKVWKNGVEQNYLDTPAADKDFKFDTSTGKLVFFTAPAAGETYRIWIQAGDAVAETIVQTL